MVRGAPGGAFAGSALERRPTRIERDGRPRAAVFIWRFYLFGWGVIRR
jgi:hypothetical protein